MIRRVSYVASCLKIDNQRIVAKEILHMKSLNCNSDEEHCQLPFTVNNTIKSVFIFGDA